MIESNIFFATNTFNYGGAYSDHTVNKFKERRANVSFFRQVMDYDALMKLKNDPRMHGTMNSNYYTAHIDQIRILDPRFESVSVGRRTIDPEIEEENRIHDIEYGYCEDNDFYPLIEEIIVDDKEFDYADEILGKWVQTDFGDSGDVEDHFSIYIKQRAERDYSESTIAPKEAGFEDIEDTDPYYYRYEKAASSLSGSTGQIDKAKLYEQTYGSIFRAFAEVTQEEIIEAPVKQWSFVNAGPGTGKTYTLMKKITYMVEEKGVDPESILVLCFTNAAVNEIKSRIKRHIAEGGERTFINVDVRTFHSFSWLLIGQANEVFGDRSDYNYIDITSLNYEKSILAAMEIIKKYGDEVFGACEHLIIDEIQDLTNEKAALVITIVKECIKNEIGMTVLGDSCQAIYDYNDDSVSCEIKSKDFYYKLFSELYENGEFYSLEKNHRQNDRLKSITIPLRKSILEGQKNDIRAAIVNLEKKVHGVIDGNSSISVSMPESDFELLQRNETVCLLCRNNAQVLATSVNLRKRGIKHIVNAYNEFEYLSDWIGRIFGLYTNEAISYDEMKDGFSKLPDKDNFEEIWIRLQDGIGSRNNYLKVRDILSVIAKSKVDDPIFRNVPRGNLIVSNIHRAKGREYDTVLLEKKFVNRLIRESKSIRSTNDYLGEAKTLYVAITRPKTNIYFNNLASNDVKLKYIRTGRKRWVSGDGRNLKHIEVRGLSDVDVLSYNTPDIQKYVLKNISEGDEINLVMNNKNGIITYDVVHVSENGERKIAETTVELVDDIEAIITPYGSPWPKRILDLYVSGIYTQISKEFDNAWCWVDFCGLGLANSDYY